jgi:hypothetical protein
MSNPCERCKIDLDGPRGPKSSVTLKATGEIDPHKNQLTFDLCFVCIMEVRKFVSGWKTR